MHRLALLLTIASVAAHADTLVCQSVNGHSTCVRATGNVSCTTVNGETRCTRIEPDQVEPPPPPLPVPDVPGVDIRQENGRLHVRAGDTEVEVPQ